MYKDAIETQDAYAINQYNACCRYLDIPASFDVEGKTLLEKIVQLTEQRDRLAEALKEYREALHDGPENCSYKMYEAVDEFAREALQSLNQPEPTEP